MSHIRAAGQASQTLCYSYQVRRILRDSGRIAAWVFVTAVILFFATKHLWFDSLQAGEKAIFWTNVAVAFGTLALAVVTLASVLETRAVLRGEDRRHEQSYAPFLTLGDYLNTDEKYEGGYTVRNSGMGIALSITFEVRGRVTVASFDFPPGPVDAPMTTIEEQTAYREKYKELNDFDISDQESLSASFPGGYDTFSQEILKSPPGPLAEIEDVTYSHCVLRYHDIFGNRYETRYTDDRLDRFDWVQPVNLRSARRS